jgi:hypothetical protein
MRQVFKDGLKKWDALPESRRKPGAVQVGDPGKVDAKYTRTLPPGGLVVRVNTRSLELKDGKYARLTNCPTKGGERSARDFLWLTAAEVKQFAPAGMRPGRSFPVPAAVAQRIARFHLVDNTQGEPGYWKPEEVRQTRLTLTAESVTADAVDLRLDGTALLANHADPAKATKGFDARLRGQLRYAPAKQAFERFDVAVVADRWSEGQPKAPIGIVFERADPDKPANRVPPQGAREWDYIGK